MTLYTDGACVGNPGPGGYGVVLLREDSRHELSGGFRWTTNNRMEIAAVIEGLNALEEPCEVVVVCDSRYVVNAMSRKRVNRWEEQGWMRGSKPVPNADLWERLLWSCHPHQVRFEWIRGHSGNPGHDRADTLAESAARMPDLPPDSGYEASSLARGGF